MNMKKYIAMATLLLGLTGCSWFEDPTIDKDGNKIPLLALDLPYFDASFLINAVDEATGNSATSTVKMQLRGEFVENKGLVTDLGYLRYAYDVKPGGNVLICLNPNLMVNPVKPVNFVVTGENADQIILPYRVISGVRGVSEVTVRTLDLRQLRTDNLGDVVDVMPAVTVGGVLLAPSAVLDDPDGTGMEYRGFYRVLTGGMATVSLPAAGFTELALVRSDGTSIASSSAGVDGFLRISTPVSFGEGFFVALRYADRTLGALTLRLTGNLAADISVSYNYRVEAGGRVYSGQTTDRLPADKHIVQISVPISDPSAKVSLTVHDPFLVKQEEIMLADITQGMPVALFELYLKPAIQKRLYHIRFTGFCPDNPQLSVAMTKRCEVREGTKADAVQDDWRWVEMRKGRLSAYLEPNKRHVIRVNLDNELSTYEITTDPNEVEQMLSEEIREYKLVTNKDGSVSIVALVVSDKLCDL